MSVLSRVNSSVVEATDNHEALLEMLRLMAALEGAFGRGGALLQYGRFYPHVKNRPEWLPMGQLGLCYCNCTRARYPYLAHDPVPYRYAEGYALFAGSGNFYEHAWLVDVNGRAIDLTWSDTKDVIYFGVTFNDAFIYQAMTDTRLFGILCSPPLQSRLFANKAAFESTLWKQVLPGLPSRRFRPT